MYGKEYTEYIERKEELKAKRNEAKRFVRLEYNPPVNSVQAFMQTLAIPHYPE